MEASARPRSYPMVFQRFQTRSNYFAEFSRVYTSMNNEIGLFSHCKTVGPRMVVQPVPSKSNYFTLLSQVYKSMNSDFGVFPMVKPIALVWMT